MLGFSNPLPIIQAPMAGGITTASLVGAVSEAGGIGSFGFAYSSATEIKKQLQKVRKITKNPINANFFVFPETNKCEDIEFQKAVRSLQDLPINFDRENTPIKPPYNPSLEAQLETIWREKPEVLTFHFGVPDEQIITQAKSLGITVGVTVTNIRNAELVFRAGVDFFIAQGSEAGGHLGYFQAADFDTKMTALKLLELLKQKFNLPIISAGGIMDGCDIRKYLKSGAAGVQMGTAFLCCNEAGTSTTYKKYVLEKKKRPTEFTRSFSGRWARSIQNEFTIHMKDKNILPFPIQNTLTSKLRTIANANKNGEYLSLWAGKEFARARALSVADLLHELSLEMKHGIN